MAKGGKYAAVINTLPRLGGQEPAYQEKINGVKQSILDSTESFSNDTVIRALEATREQVEGLLDLMMVATGGKRYASEFARVYALCRRVEDQMDELRKRANVILEAYTQLMTDQMEVEGTTSLKLAEGRGVSTFLEPYASVENQEAFREWCARDVGKHSPICATVVAGGPCNCGGGGGLARKMALPWQSTNSLAKEMLLRGDDLPPGVKVWAKTKVRLGSE